MKFAARASILALALYGAAHALPSDQIFERAAPGVWALRAFDANNQPFNHGSAVAIATGKAVTSCALLARASRIELHRDKTILAATLEFPDVERDLCQLDVPGLAALAPTRGSARALRVGQHVYVVGYTSVTEQMISEGMVTDLREEANERIQTSVPAAGGLLGAGLYDEEAKLLGIVTASARDASGVVSAVPVKWLTELADRGRAALASRATATALPMVGASWQYAYTMRGVGSARYTIGVRVTGVEGRIVRESIAIPSFPERLVFVGADSLSFRSFQLPQSQMLVELAPYLHSVLAKNETRMWGNLTGYPLGNAMLAPWTITVRESSQEEYTVTVAAGTFKATRIDVSGRRAATLSGVGPLAHESGRFRFRAWYAPEVQRYVKLQHETWTLGGAPSGEQLVELTSYSAK